MVLFISKVTRVTTEKILHTGDTNISQPMREVPPIPFFFCGQTFFLEALQTKKKLGGSTNCLGEAFQFFLSTFFFFWQ